MMDEQTIAVVSETRGRERKTPERGRLELSNPWHGPAHDPNIFSTAMSQNEFSPVLELSPRADRGHKLMITGRLRHANHFH